MRNEVQLTNPFSLHCAHLFDVRKLHKVYIMLFSPKKIMNFLSNPQWHIQTVYLSTNQSHMIYAVHKFHCFSEDFLAEKPQMTKNKKKIKLIDIVTDTYLQNSYVFAHHIDKIVVFILTFDNNDTICLFVYLFVAVFFLLFLRKTSSIEWVEYIICQLTSVYVMCYSLSYWWWCDVMRYYSVRWTAFRMIKSP